MITSIIAVLACLTITLGGVVLFLALWVPAHNNPLLELYRKDRRDLRVVIGALLVVIGGALLVVIGVV